MYDQSPNALPLFGKTFYLKTMKRILVLTLFIICTSLSVQAQTPAHASASRLSKGMNLANWLEASWHGNNYPITTEYSRSELNEIQQLDMSAVRIPVLLEWIVKDTAPYDSILNQKPFDLLDTLIFPVLDAQGAAVLLVNHHGQELTDANFMTAIPRVAGMWKFIVDKYKNKPTNRYFFELRNEPTNAISNANLRIYYQALIDTIRRYDPDRTLIVGGNWWNAGWSLISTTPYSDQNIIYTFHNYSPFPFTHQGFSWSNHPLGPTFYKTDPGAQDIRKDIVDVHHWAQQNNVPVFLGEFGVSWFADDTSRCNYIEHIMHVLDSVQMPWFYWDIKHGHDAFGIFNNGVIDQNDVIQCFELAMQTRLWQSTKNHSVKLNNHFYPTPSNGNLYSNKNLSGKSFLIYDSMGRLVQEIDSNPHTNYVDLTGLKNGMYTILMNHEDEYISARVFVIR